MDTYIIISISILILAIIFLSFPTHCNPESNTEGFYSNSNYLKHYCSNCGFKSRNYCSNCTNCGYCITASGYGECVFGDSTGPLFRKDCVHWEYGSNNFYYPYLYYPIIKSNSVYPFRYVTRF